MSAPAVPGPGHPDDEGVLRYAEPPSYLDWARAGRGSGVRYLVGTLAILGMWFVGQAVILIPGVLLAGGTVTPDGQFRTPQPWAELLITLLSFLPFLVATPVIVALIHRRPALTLVTCFRRLDWRLLLLGAGLWAAIMAVLAAGSLALGGSTLAWNYTPGVFWPALVIALTVLWVQTSAEELFFRGYLMQWNSLLTRNVWVLATISGLVFGIPHLANPEVAGAAGPGDLVIALLIYFSTGFALAFVSVRTGTIELALGAHFINNFASVVIVSASNSALGTPSLWVDTEPGITGAAIGSVISAVAFIGLTRWCHARGVLRPLVPAWRRTASVPPPPAAWYPDPVGMAAWRWWDGRQWTEHVHGAPGVAPGPQPGAVGGP